MFSTSPAITLDVYQLFLPLALSSVNSATSVLKSPLPPAANILCKRSQHSDSIEPCVSFVFILLHTLLSQAKCQAPYFQAFPHTLAKTPGVGYPRSSRSANHSLSARLRELCVGVYPEPLGALSCPPLFPSTFNCRTKVPIRSGLSTFPLPQNFYPPTLKLRHNPAAQGHTSVPLHQRAHSSSHTGRIQ
jgi:hypothetical protein